MKILIVDDDLATVDMIEKVCDWNSLDITSVLKAYDGEEAERIIEAETPDIVLCDIGMPKTDGVSVLKWIREKDIRCEFVFLTCYSDFEYAREAVRYGAVDYLTKPFEPEALFACMRNVVSKIKQKQSPDTNGQENRLRTEQFLYSIVEGVFGADHDEIREVMKSVCPGTSPDAPTRIVCVRIDCREAVSKGWKKSLFKSAVEHVFVEMMTDNIQDDFLLSRTDGPFEIEYLFLPDDQNSVDYYIERANDALKFISDHLVTAPLIIIGEIAPFFRSQEEYTKINRKLEQYSFLNGKVSAIEKETKETELQSYSLDKELIRNSLLARNKNQLINYIGSLINEAITDEAHSAPLIKQIHHDLLQIILVCMEENDIDAHTIFKSENIELLNARSEKSAIDMIKYVSALYDQCTVILQNKSQDSGVIAEVKKYIHEHYREDINRDNIAQAVFLTPNYLSKLFCGVTGITLRQYINDCRIHEAKQRLAATNQSISDIAFDLGFENVSYFSTVFKKNCGVGPLAWRNKATGKPVKDDEE
ncbi:MAG: response regulator [Solobacterium sp.]|jgi:two-component system response regulator YesN|nr:response regulator [Solobacterium sp.]